MDAQAVNNPLHNLFRNLAAGARLIFGRPIGRDDFVYSLDQSLLLIAAAIGFEIAAEYAFVQQPATYSAYGLTYLLAIYAVDIVAILLVVRLAKAQLQAAGELIIATLASAPLFAVYLHIAGYLQEYVAETDLQAWAIWLSPIAWQLFILTRLLRVVLDLRIRKSMLFAAIQTGIGFGSLWVLPYTMLWYADEPVSERSSPYEALSKLSVEDLFYDQYRLVDDSLAQLADQRPGVTDLYLLAVGGYGLENVFLNEVEYVRDLFDERFDTERHSAILVNNVETTSQYPLANGHNLQALLNGMADRMDVDEDILFLFMTSHGSDDHHFSLHFGPVKLDDLNPRQVRQALDDAGIRWRVVVVSSCYSGGFVEPLRNPQTLIITAAAANRRSFGCGATSDFTDFGTAYFKQALGTQIDFVAAFDTAERWVSDKEQRERREASYPQRFVGGEIEAKLAAYRGALRDPSSTTAALTPLYDCTETSASTGCRQ